MHYYQFNIADYRKDTQHLTPIEHYIYRELMDWYYLDEQPIPVETQPVTRRLRLGSENTQDVENILEEFFEKTENGFIHGRIEEEIERYMSIAETARANGRKGGRPKKPRKTQPVILANPELTQTKANQEPITNNQEPIHIQAENSSEVSRKNVNIPYSKIIDLYHHCLPMLPKVARLNNSRKSKIRLMWNDDMDDISSWDSYFCYVAKSKFLTGKVHPHNGRKVFRADIDWLINSNNAIKVEEGKYHG